MANFRAYPGLFVKAVKTEDGLVKDATYQVLNIRFNITLLGIQAVYSYERFAQLVEPMPMDYYDIPAKFTGIPEDKGPWILRIFK